MGDLGNAFKYLYSQFILRDVLSFVTPGAIVALTGFVIFLPGSFLGRLEILFEYSRSIHWLLYIPIFGVFYMAGFATQCFGEIIGFTRVHKIATSCFHLRLKIFRCKNWDKVEWWKKAYKEVIEFHKVTEENKIEWASSRDERNVVLLQMCSNGFLAIIIAGIISVLIWFGKSPLYLLILGIPLLASLFWGHRVQVLRQADTAKGIIDRYSKNTSEKNKGNGEGV